MTYYSPDKKWFYYMYHAVKPERKEKTCTKKNTIRKQKKLLSLYLEKYWRRLLKAPWLFARLMCLWFRDLLVQCISKESLKVLRVRQKDKSGNRFHSIAILCSYRKYVLLMYTDIIGYFISLLKICLWCTCTTWTHAFMLLHTCAAGPHLWCFSTLDVEVSVSYCVVSG